MSRLENKEKCIYCREYGNFPCEECDRKLAEKSKGMSRLEEIKNEVAKSKNLKSWNEMDYKGYVWDSDVESVAKQYAKECVKVSLIKASENAKMKSKNNIHELSMMDDWTELDKDSITNPENIVIL